MSEIRRFKVDRAKASNPGKELNTSRVKASYAGKTPVSAAKKAFSDLCTTKRNCNKRKGNCQAYGRKGVCSLNVHIKEVPSTSSGLVSKQPSQKPMKTFMYRIKRKVEPRVVDYNGESITHRYKIKAMSLAQTHKRKKTVKFN
tara:strand:- start:3908 stop:4336 length:429 start_codon:yes stop_codon:yes gene_type:complete